MKGLIPQGQCPQVVDRSGTHWKRQLHQFASDLCAEMRLRPEVSGIAIGGSLARGMEWRHSDVEVGIVVTEHIPDVGHFNVRERRGFEVFQFVESDWLEELRRARVDPTAVLQWPIQMYRCRIVFDAAGIFRQFKEIFDAALFQPAVVSAQLALVLARFDAAYVGARRDLRAGYPLSALAGLRDAFNNLILAFYWRHGMLPRSQTRTAALLRIECRRLGTPEFYELFRQVYALSESVQRARDLLEACRDDVERAVEVWGPGAPGFFRYAVDGYFEWGIHHSVLTVHRLCVPICVRAVAGQERVFDDSAWREEHLATCAFLGLMPAEAERAPALFERVAEARAAFDCS